MKRVCFQAPVIASLLFVFTNLIHAELIWPTPNPAFQKGRPLEEYVQPTSSGKLESGLFGCVRNDGARFHEGLDLFPIQRDARGEALDDIHAVLSGLVVHVNTVVGHSSYGRYVVIKHDGESPAFHTLYAHLASIGPGVQLGTRVSAGTILGKMGRSAGGYSIPPERAHLHFEMGFKLTDKFQTYYDRQKYGSENRHGNWNGMNLVSVDPLGFYEAIRSGRAKNIAQYLKMEPAVARIRVHTSKVPNFVKNYPALVTRSYASLQVVAWDIAFTQYGVPKEWTPRFADEGLDGRSGDVGIVSYRPKLLSGQSCRRVLNTGGTRPSISHGTINTLKLLFGFK